MEITIKHFIGAVLGGLFIYMWSSDIKISITCALASFIISEIFFN